MHKQKGFTAVEVVIVLLVILLLAAGGWYLWKKNSDKSTTEQSANSAQQQTSNQDAANERTDTQAPAKTYLEVKEWGVKVTLDDDSKDAYYVIKSEGPNYAYLSVRSLTNPDCAPDQVSVGVITRFKQGDIEPISERPYTETVPDATKVGDYYYYYGRAQAYCDENQEAKLKAVDAAFNKSVKTIEAIN